jgi:hypothetical protein
MSALVNRVDSAMSVLRPLMLQGRAWTGRSWASAISGVELHPVPNEVPARVPQTRGYRYVVANDRVLLVGTSRIVVGVFADANAR